MVFRNARFNAAVAWLLILAVGVVAVDATLAGNVRLAGLGSVIAALALVPSLVFRDRTAMVPWEVLLLASLPLLGRPLLPGGVPALLVTHLSVAALALVLAVELHVFTAVRMTDWFAVAFVVVATIAATGIRAIGQWLSDEVLGTGFVTDLESLMVTFTWTSVTGIGAGVVFALYFRRFRGLDHDAVPGGPGRDRAASPPRSPVRLRDRFGVSERHERQLVGLIQLALGCVFVSGVLGRDVSVVVNSGLALCVLGLPGILEREYHLSLDSGLVLRVTAAIVVHAIGYTTVYVLSEHTGDVYVPPRLLGVFVLLFVLAAGVLWEVLEFLVTEAAPYTGIDDVLVQYGLRDTMLDLVADLVGGLVVAVWGRRISCPRPAIWSPGSPNGAGSDVSGALFSCDRNHRS